VAALAGYAQVTALESELRVSLVIEFRCRPEPVNLVTSGAAAPVRPVGKLSPMRVLMAILAAVVGFAELQVPHRPFRFQQPDPAGRLQEGLVTVDTRHRLVSSIKGIGEFPVPFHGDRRRVEPGLAVTRFAAVLRRAFATRLEPAVVNIQVAGPALGFDPSQGDPGGPD
jgi:hypothetical protein